MSESIFGYPTILLSDGTREWVGGNAEDTDAEFQRIIRERLGDDAEEVYKALKDYWLEFYAYNTKEEDNAEQEEAEVEEYGADEQDQFPSHHVFCHGEVIDQF